MKTHWRIIASMLVSLALTLGSACGPAIVETQESPPVEEEPSEEPSPEPADTATPTPTVAPPPTKKLETATPTPTATATETPDRFAELLAQLLGEYDAETAFFSGNKDHFLYIKLPVTMKLEVSELPDGLIKFDGPDNWVDVSGVLAPDGTFEAQGTGTVAGYPNVTVTFSGTVLDGSLDGLYTMGPKGELPGGESITYHVEGAKQP